MGASLSRTKLYRRALGAVIWVIAILSVTQRVYPQFAQRSTVSKGPRAVGLLELRPNGTADLIPVCIMIGGHFYDASIYKANPVPMALDAGTVYEAERTGASFGLFTIQGALERTGSWIGQGSFEPVGAKHSQQTLKAEGKPREEEDKPPVLRHPGTEPPKTETKPTETKPTETKPSSTPAQASSSSTASTKTDQNASPDENDPNRPRLRRGAPPKPVPSTRTDQGSAKASPKSVTASSSASAPSGETQLIPAVSDADGPDARPYTYQMGADEQQAYGKKILALVSDELVKVAKAFEPDLVGAPRISSAKGRSAAESKSKPPQPIFHDVNLRAFDVATNNEPILVVTAKAQLPERVRPSAEQTSSPPEFYVALVAHSDLYGTLRPLFSAITDGQHLDVTPRFDLIDVVDADGDGRGELLFRKTSDQGSAYVIYRVGADKLWPLYDGTPSGH